MWKIAKQNRDYDILLEINEKVKIYTIQAIRDSLVEDDSEDGLISIYSSSSDDEDDENDDREIEDLREHIAMPALDDFVDAVPDGLVRLIDHDATGSWRKRWTQGVSRSGGPIPNKVRARAP